LILWEDYIRRCRFDKDETSQQDLAHAMEVTRQTIYSIEKGKYPPSALLAIKIAKYFNKSFEKVFYIIG